MLGELRVDLQWCAVFPHIRAIHRTTTSCQKDLSSITKNISIYIYTEYVSKQVLYGDRIANYSDLYAAPKTLEALKPAYPKPSTVNLSPKP